ncbi:DUF1281 domain-containing protein [Photobacterium leiognathi]|uniref:DUF1281 domain-containing protein n=1 Tax=Photobacterium leiognathi TaxID=553611 RepID=UPI002738EDE4|nr:DUF1281 domain-containing protein [Photobacterium leiognathi]
MPNWCANQLFINAKPDVITRLASIVNGQVELTYRRAITASQKLFLAGVAGILKPTVEMVYPPYPELVRGVGALTPENQAFTQWLDLLSNNVELTPERAEEILSLFEQAKIKNIAWGAIQRSRRDVMKAVFRKKQFDWSENYKHRVSVDEFWMRCDVLVQTPCYAHGFDMALIIPSLLAVEVNGFNGGLLHGVERGFNDATCRYGTKWTRVDAVVEDRTKEAIVIDFDTAWSPSLEVTQCLSERYQCDVTHYYAESGCGYGGCYTFECGECVEQQTDDLIFSEENEEGYVDVVGPDYIVDNLGHFGG